MSDFFDTYLDPKETYIVGAIAMPGFLEEIKHVQECEIPLDERWTHSGMLHTSFGQWLYTDADLKEGVLQIPWEEELRRTAGVCEFEYMLHDLDIDEIGKRVGQPFSKKKFAGFKSGKIEHDDGVTCGELIALCDDGVLCEALHKEPMFIRSVDIQGWGQLEACKQIWKVPRVSHK